MTGRVALPRAQGSGVRRFEPRWCRGAETTPPGGKLVAAWTVTFSDFCFGESRCRRGPSPYWITSSARPSNDGGIVRPRALGGLEVDHQLELRRLFHGEIPGLGAFEDLFDERRRMAKQVRVVCTVTSQAACFHILPGTDNGRQSMFDRELSKPLTVGEEHRARDNVDRSG